MPDGGGPDAALCLVAAGAAAWLRGEVGAAVRLASTALGRLPAGHPQRWAGQWFRALSHMYAGDAGAVTAEQDSAGGRRGTPVGAGHGSLQCGADEPVHRRPAPGAGLAERPRELLAEIGAVDGFVAYTRGELAAEVEPECALSWFELAHRRNDERGVTFNREVAGVGRAAVLLRLGRHREAGAALRGLINALRRVGMCRAVDHLRLTAELLLELGDPRTAATLLAAADSDPLAPPVLGPDRVRLDRLWQRIGLETGRAAAPPPGRQAAVELALAALDRHR